MSGIVLSILLMLIGIAEWRRFSPSGPFRLALLYIFLYGINVAMILLNTWDVPTPSLGELISWLTDPVARPAFDWLREGAS